MKASAETIAKRFVAYLKEEEVYALLPDIVKELEAEVSRNQDINVISAVELSPAEQKNITKELTAKWGEHQVVFSIDAAILSGLLIRFQDNIIDLSGRHHLNDLKNTLVRTS